MLHPGFKQLVGSLGVPGVSVHHHVGGASGPEPEPARVGLDPGAAAWARPAKVRNA